jgi:hypothetical protein
LRHGIGIHAGSAIAGNTGSSERLPNALPGDAGVAEPLRVPPLVKAAVGARLRDDYFASAP